MSFTAVRSFFRTRLDGLGYQEWTDGFNFDNIPSSTLDGTYHLTTGTITGGPSNSIVHEFDYSITVRVFFRGELDPASAIDDALAEAETIHADILAPANRLGTAIKDIEPGTVDALPQDVSNDNNVILEMVFNANIFCDFR